MAGALWPPVAGNAGPLSLRDIDHSAVHDQFNVLSGRLFCTDAADILVEAATLLAQGIHLPTYNPSSAILMM